MEASTQIHQVNGPRIYRLPQVMAMYGLSKASVYRLVAQKRFPAPVKIGSRAVGWKYSDLDVWEKGLKHE